MKFDVSTDRESGTATIALQNGTFKLTGDSLRILDAEGNVNEELPLALVYADGTKIDLKYDLVGNSVLSFSGEVVVKGESFSDSDSENVQALPMKWEGSWDECVSGAGVAGAVAGLVGGLATGGIVSLPAAVLGMLGSGIGAALTACNGLPKA